MKRIIVKSVCFVIAFAIAFSFILPAMAAETVVKIYTANDLNQIRNNLSGKYELMADIDVSGIENFTPIGTVTSMFTGELNGNGFSVTGLTQKAIISDEILEDEPDWQLVWGLFGYTKNAKIKNVVLKDVDIELYNTMEASAAVGAFAGVSDNTQFIKCSVQGKISVVCGGDIFAGGFVGFENGDGVMLSDCLSKIKLNAEYKNEDAFSFGIPKFGVGGFLGTSTGASSFTNCCFFGEISVKEAAVAGCFAGELSNKAHLENCRFLNGAGLPVGNNKGAELNSVSAVSGETNIAEYNGFDFEKNWTINQNGIELLFEEKSKQVELVSAKIVKIPFLRHFLFFKSDHKLEKITMEFTFSDGKTKTVTVNETNGNYLADGFQIICTCQNKRFGLETVNLAVLNDEQIIRAGSYKCFCVSFFYLIIGNR